jgi:FkbM family methyltransferase
LNLPFIPSNTLLGKAARLPLRLIPSDTVVTVRGGITKGMKWRVGANTHGCWLGTYEATKQAAVRDLIKPGMNILDIGANAGFYTLAFSALAGPSGHVWAIEPFAENVRNLSFHVGLNELRNVTIVQTAISNQSGVAHFQAHASNSMGKLSVAPTSLIVPTISIDELVSSGIPPPDLVKIDIEGAELSALHGAKRLLAQRRTTWLVALDEPQTNDECRRLLSSAGYHVSDLGSKDEIIAA